MTFEHYLLLIFAIPPLINRFSFWLYTIQLKEYRRDRFREYLWTLQWNSAMINIWTVIELPLLFVSLYIFKDRPFEIIIYNVVFVFLLIQNIFVLRKIFTWKILKPVLTGRLLLTVLLLAFWLSIYLYFLIFWWYIISFYTYILSFLLFAPLYIFLVILISLPVVNHLKNKKIKKAINKIKKNKKTIKIWITWSYWKSSVKEFLASILEQHWSTLKTPENVNSELWVAEIVIWKLKNSFEYFVAEMWAYRIWEISLLWKIVNHEYGFLTAIWNQHIWLFWSQSNIKTGKAEIANSVLKNDWILYVNWNDKYIRETKFDNKLDIIKYWNYEWSDAIYSWVRTKEWSTTFTYEYKKHKIKFNTNLLWKHNIINLTWVISLCYDLWLTTLEIKRYLKNIKSPKNTLSLIKTENNILIDDTYNLSEDCLYAWLDVINSYNSDKILVIDDILELWKEADNVHYVIWKFIAKRNSISNVLFCWVNHKKSFIKWLLDWWFKEENIIQNLYKIEEDSVILFEWRWSKKYLDNLMQNV